MRLGFLFLYVLRGDSNIDECLRDDPPVVVTHRRCGDEIITGLLAAEHLPFGDGWHQCPGQAQARALAAGIIHAIRASDLAPDTSTAS